MTRVLILDDHPIVVHAFRGLADPAEEVRLEGATRPREALTLYRMARPDLLVVDVTLGGETLSGIRFLRRMRAIDPTLPILVFSMHGDPSIVRRALAAGATGYVCKDAAPSEIRAACRSVRGGRRFLAADLALEVALETTRPDPGPLPALTRREREILELLAEGRSYGEIGAALGLSYKTVANVCSILKSKIDATTLPDLVCKAVRHLAPAGGGP